MPSTYHRRKIELRCASFDLPDLNQSSGKNRDEYGSNGKCIDYSQLAKTFCACQMRVFYKRTCEGEQSPNILRGNVQEAPILLRSSAHPSLC